MNSIVNIYFLIFGLLIGSFLNVLILRLPKKKDVVKARSSCPDCGTQLKWYHNVPVISFLLLRGKCGFCKNKISWRYPLIEIITGLVAFWLAPSDYGPGSLANFCFYFTVACVFICHLVIDLEHHLLLDSLNLYLLGVFLVFAVFTFPWQYWVFGGGIGFGVPFAVTWIFYKLRGMIGLGGGDIKLFGILGIYLGPVGIIFNIFMSCLIGATIGIVLILLNRITKDKPMAFGPSILLVATLQIFFPDISKVIQSFFFV